MTTSSPSATPQRPAHPTGAADLTAGGRLRAQEQAENFPVALRVLPRQLREDLRAVYDVARVVDELGDRVAGDRTAQLEAFRADLLTVWTTGSPASPVLQRLVPTVRAHALDHEPFDRLVQANLQDQVVAAYATFEELVQYCTLSADPVGRIVLGLLGATTPERVALSDRICTALQVLEHCQDVGEDRRDGRTYLPAEDLERFGVGPADLDAATAGPAVRRLLAFETDRAVGLLREGSPLVGTLHGWGRLAVAGFVAGGLAAADSVRRPGTDVLVASPRVRRTDVARHLLSVLGAAAW